MNYLLNLNVDTLKICLEFLSLEEIRELDNVAELSSNHDQLLEAIQNAEINNDLDQPINILMFRWLRARRMHLTRFNFEGDGIETWYMELTNNLIDDNAFNPFRNVEHIDFDRLLAIPICEGIDRANLFQLIIYRCASVLATDNKPKKGLLKTIKVGKYFDIPDKSIYTMIERQTLIDNLSLRGCTEISNACIESVASRCKGLTSLDIAHCHNIDDEVLVSIAKHCPRMLCLDLECLLLITDEGVAAIANSCTDLRSLNLTECKLITDGSIVDMSRKCASLVTINLAQCRLLTDVSIESIGKWCPQLQIIDLAHNDQITGLHFEMYC